MSLLVFNELLMSSSLGVILAKSWGKSALSQFRVNHLLTLLLNVS